MCKYDSYQIGKKYTFKSSDGAEICDECGSNQSPKGKHDMIYLGHSILKRYGVCDVFQYVTPVVCLECGHTSNMWADPCESGVSVNSLVESEEVERW